MASTGNLGSGNLEHVHDKSCQPGGPLATNAKFVREGLGFNSSKRCSKGRNHPNSLHQMYYRIFISNHRVRREKTRKEDSTGLRHGIKWE